MDLITQANDGNFEEIISGADKPLLIDFWASWCGPCKMLAPILDEVATDLEKTGQVVKVNVEDNPESATKYGVTSIPTLAIVKDGKLLDTMVGVKPKEAIVKWFEEKTK